MSDAGEKPLAAFVLTDRPVAIRVAPLEIAQHQSSLFLHPVDHVEPPLGRVQPVPQISGYTRKAEDEKPFHQRSLYR